MQNFPSAVGITHRFQIGATDANGNPDPNGVNGAVVWSTSTPTLVTLTPNAGVQNETQCDVAAQTVGVATVTATWPNEANASISASFTLTISDIATSGTFSELS